MINMPDDATLLEQEDIEQLIPSHITTRAQLNVWEHRNIQSAESWAFKQKLGLEKLISIHFIKQLHKKMFDEVWKWAGQFRKSNRNIGIDWLKISTELKKLCDDTSYWLNNNSFSLDEIAVRFHFRLVWIHPFPNGNGRHGRLMTDLLLFRLGQSRFTWGSANLVEHTLNRKHYIVALRSAEKGDHKPLLRFVRS